jgi:hypothetical protein
VIEIIFKSIYISFLPVKKENSDVVKKIIEPSSKVKVCAKNQFSKFLGLLQLNFPNKSTVCTAEGCYNYAVVMKKLEP